MEVTFSRRLIVGGRCYEITASGIDDDPLHLRLLGRGQDGEVVTEVTGTIPPDDLPALTDVVTSTLTNW
jgi:hypothetical protein